MHLNWSQRYLKRYRACVGIIYRRLSSSGEILSVTYFVKASSIPEITGMSPIRDSAPGT